MAEGDASLYVHVTDALRQRLHDASSSSSSDDSCLAAHERDALAAVEGEDRISLQRLQLLHKWLRARGEADGVICSLLKRSKVLARKKAPQVRNTSCFCFFGGSN